ncbi:MAG: gliding motility-associated C-terminal domain-containing protein [Cytophagales bacterium]
MTNIFTWVKKSFIVFIFALIALPSEATHYQGGDITYEFLGIFGGQYRYRFQLDVYVNCLPTSNFPNGEVNNLDLCIYNGTTNALFTSRTMTNPFRQFVQPDLPPGCSVPIINQVLCSRLNRFTEVIDLPGPFNEYYAIHERCCRENAIDNLQNAGSTGNTFVTEMPPNFVQNSSPQFQDVVIPFLCTSDTITLSNNAIDPDGDFLVYNFVQPYDQFTGGVAPSCAPTYNANAIPGAPYAPNYSIQDPFGPGSYAFINASNGLTKYYTPNAGKYSLAIEIQEYRDINNDGIQDLIGTIYREIIFIAEACAPNPTPVISPVNVNGSPVPIIGNTGDIDINEGESLTFSFTSNDPNNDSVYIEPSGSILDGSNGYTGPLAIFPDTVGLGSATTNFNWQTACGITGQFVVRIDLKDNGCPPKNDIYFINVNVRPFEATDQIATTDPGLEVDSICFGLDTIEYVAQINAPNTVTWAASGGNIIGSNTSDTIRVVWTNAGLNQLSLIETNSLSCTDTSSFNINVIALDTITASADLFICEGDSVQLNASGTSGYQWTPNQFISNTLTPNPFVFPTDTTVYIVSNPNASACVLNDSVKVSVVKNFAEAGVDEDFCSGDTVQIGSASLTNKTYIWSSAVNLSDGSISDPFYTNVISGPSPNIDTLIVTTTDTVNGCIFTDDIIVVTNPLPIADAGLADTICSAESTTLGISNPGPNSNCSWIGNFVGSPNSCQTLVTPVNPGSTNLTYQYVLNITNTSTTCQNSDTVEIVSKPLPPVNAGLDTAICRLQTLQLGGSATPGVVYSWVTNATSSPISPTNASDPNQTFNTSGNFQSIVTAINTNPANLCTNRDTIDVFVRNLPNVQVIPDTVICSEDSINIGGPNNSIFTYEWNTQTGLNDSTISNPLLSINNATQVSQFVNYQVVVENTVSGCIDSSDTDIEIKPLPIVDPGPDLAICSESSDTLGVSSTAGYNYLWSSSQFLDDSTLARPEISPITGNNPVTLKYDLQIEWNGCFDDDSVFVTVNPKPVVDTIIGGVSICPNLEDVLYTVLDTVGFINYTWGISGGLFISPTNNDSVLVDWGGLNPNALLYMIPTNSFNCIGDTTFLPIDINPILSSPPPLGPNSICLSNANTVVYSVPFTSGYNYVWSSPQINHNINTILPGNQVAYDFLEPGVAQIFVEQQVTTTTSTCLGFSDTLEVIIHPDPDLSVPIVGDTSICEFTTGIDYTVNGFPNSTYQWSVLPGGSAGDSTNLLTLSWGAAGNYQVIAFETTEFGCTSGNLVLDVQINPIPETDFASVDTFVCAETVNGNSYVADGFANSNYIWDVVGGSFEQNDSSQTALVTWDPDQNNLEINVFEISEFNCTGDPVSFSPTLDLSLPLVSNVSLTSPEDTFSNILISYNKGFDYTDLIPDTLTLYRKIATSSNWTPIAEVSSADSIYLDTDNLNRLDNYYEYQVSSRNLCSNEIFSPQHNTIKLEGEGIEDLDQLELFWNEYVNYSNGLQEYEIYRRLDDQDSFEIFQNTGANSYTDFSANDGFRHFFRVRAIEGGGENESWSNEFLVIFLNTAKVADVITPNGDGKNDTWKIDNIELYPGTEVKIFNRYGTEVYKTSDYKGDWAADNLPSGTYFFQAVFQHLDEPVGGYITVLR